ncbi:hypothetical protein [Pedobacter sp. V48]|uniref:hypothetical protein n=1 Tax=Pedobacter sp. V48 TaxID=509635 RepID=UPI001269591A|nr:hypothetical protein [Pedobacter sp. V48]
MSELTEKITASNRRFNDDEIAKTAFKNTDRITGMSAGDYDALLYPGGHGPIWDLAGSDLSGQLILVFLDAGKPVEWSAMATRL